MAHRSRLSTLKLFLLPALLLAACAEESPVDRQPAGRIEPEPSRKTPSPPRPEASLVSTGRLAYEGGSTLRCVVHGETGLQLNFRTGDLDLPAVAVRIAEYRGEGRYRGDLFLTGRDGGGALLGSTGTVEVQVGVQTGPPRPADARGVQALSGTFEGQYAGTAGEGTVRGRFELCPYRPARGGLPQMANEPAPPQPATPGGP